VVLHVASVGKICILWPKSPFISETVRDKPVVTMDSWQEVRGTRSIRFSSDDFEWPWNARQLDARRLICWLTSAGIVWPIWPTNVCYIVWPIAITFGLLTDMGNGCVFVGQSAYQRKGPGLSASNFGDRPSTYARTVWPRTTKYGVVTHPGKRNFTVDDPLTRDSFLDSVRVGVSLFVSIPAGTPRTQFPLPRIPIMSVPMQL